MAKTKKLSKMELAAQKSGGTLNYKTGKVSVAPKTNTRAVAAKGFDSSKESIFDYAKRTGQQSDYEIGRSASAKMAIPFGYKTLTEPEKKAYQTSQDTYKKQQDAKAKSIENRKKASQVVQQNNERVTNENSTPSTIGRILQVASDPFGVLGEKGLGAKKWGNDLKESLGIDVTKSLGIDDYLRSAAGVKTADAAYFPEEAAPTDETPTLSYDNPFQDQQRQQDDQAAKERAAAEDQQRIQDEQDLLSGATQRGNGATYRAPVAQSAQEPDMNAEVKKQLKGMGFGEQESDTKSYFKKLLEQLDPEYAAYQKQAQDELEKSKRDDIGRLMGIFAGNNTADSEQRAQQQELVQNDYAAQLVNLLAKLAAQKSNDRLDIEGKRYNALNDISNSKRTAQQRVMDMLQSAQTKRSSGGVSRSSSAKAPSREEIFNWTQDALAKGYSWQEIADAAKEQKIPTYTGSYIDQLLNKAF